MLSLKRSLFNCTNTVESLKCMKCINFETYKLVDLKHHLETGRTLPQLQEKFYECEICNFQTYSSLIFLRHKSPNFCMRSEKVDFRVVTTNKTELKEDRRRSNRKSEEQKLHNCKRCPYTTKYRSSLKKHILHIHTDPDKIRWFYCGHCSYKSKTKGDLKRHKDSKHGNRAIINCHYCPFETKFRTGLKNHILFKHSDPDQIDWLFCGHCSYKAKTRGNLKQHVKNRHDEEKKFKCKNCPFETKSKQQLKRHVLYKHTDLHKIEWFYCQLCAHKAKMKNDLASHIKNKHNAEKRFKCENCLYETNFKKDLKIHIVRKHTDPDKIEWFSCEFCPLKTKTRTYLNEHLNNVHSRKKYDVKN